MDESQLCCQLTTRHCCEGEINKGVNRLYDAIITSAEVR